MRFRENALRGGVATIFLVVSGFAIMSNLLFFPRWEPVIFCDASPNLLNQLQRPRADYLVPKFPTVVLESLGVESIKNLGGQGDVRKRLDRFGAFASIEFLEDEPMLVLSKLEFATAQRYSTELSFLEGLPIWVSSIEGESPKELRLALGPRGELLLLASSIYDIAVSHR